MRLENKLLALITFIVFSSSVCFGATITGKVKGPGGTPFGGAFVEAQDAKTRMTFMVLSDSQGRYSVRQFAAWRVSGHDQSHGVSRRSASRRKPHSRTKCFD